MNVARLPLARRAIVAAALAASAAVAAAAPLYSVTRIAPHDPRRWVDIEGSALNQLGGVAGTDITHGRPFRWSAAAGLEWLEDLPGGDDHDSQAWDINDAGVVVGIGRIRGAHRSGQRVARPVAWMPGDTAAHDLGKDLNPKAHVQWEGYAYAINDSGIVAGISGPQLRDHPFTLDTATGTPQLLGAVLYPYDIDESGGTLGPGPYDPRTGGSIYQYRAPDGHRVDLPSGIGANRLNNLGQAAGSDDSFRAIVWSEAAGVAVLPTPAGLLHCDARDLNDHGVAIGTCYYADDQPHAILWTPDGSGGYTAQDIRDLVPPDSRRPEGCLVKPGGGTPHCFGEEGVAINNAGQLLVDELKSRHRTLFDSEPLLLTPPAAR